jgi:D-sedoheptulose 7-phosphate isomerase
MTSSISFVPEYLDGFVRVLDSINQADMQQLVTRVIEAYREGRQLFIAGNGGSAATASHAAADFGKTMLGRAADPQARRFRVLSLVDNVSLLTAYANDVGYASVFAEQLRTHAQQGDVLLVISASGNSPNIIEALDAARELGVETLGLLGCDGGKALSRVDHAVTVRSDHFGYIEDAHTVVMHMITEALKKALQVRELV